jgi:hypothetical protein
MVFIGITSNELYTFLPGDHNNHVQLCEWQQSQIKNISWHSVRG